MMETLFLINVRSGKNRRKNFERVAQLIRDTYRDAGKKAEAKMIDFTKLDSDLAVAVKQGTRNIFAVGGDGTVNAIGSRLVGSHVNFGVIPIGSGNGFARNIGFSTHLPLALKQSVDAKAIQIDTGIIEGRPFLNVAGIGIDADVVDRFASNKIRGFVQYVKTSALAFLGYKPITCTVEVDGKLVEHNKVMVVAVANGTQWGYEARMSPKSSLCDGLLDIVIVRNFPFMQVGPIIARLFSGKIKDSKYIKILPGRKVVIRRESPGIAQVDGEPFNAGEELEISIRERSLNLLLPSTLSEEKISSL